MPPELQFSLQYADQTLLEALTALPQIPELYSAGLILKEARGQEFVLCPRKKKKEKWAC